VQSLRINGKRHDRAYLRHRDIARGGTLEFEMGPSPSRWATGRDAVPPSVTRGNEVAEPLRDATGAGAGAGSAAALFDDDSRTTAAVGDAVEYRFPAPQRVSFYTLTNGTADGGDPASWRLLGSNDGERWRELDERSGEEFRWRSQTRPFKVDKPRAYTHYRIETGAATLGEVELLNPAPPDTSALTTSTEGAVASSGETVPVSVTVSNFGEEDASGSVAVSAPDGWTVTPSGGSFGPLGNGGSQTLEFSVAVPAGATAGNHPVRFIVTSDAGTVRDTATVAVITDRIEFAPGSDAEAPWLFESAGSQLNGEVPGGRARFTDGSTTATYRFRLPADVQGGTLELDIGAEFLVHASTDGTNWEQVLRHDGHEHNLANRATRSLDLNALRNGGRTVYLRLGDSFPDDGWGGWLARVTVQMQRGG
jgi:hypothetical protein